MKELQDFLKENKMDFNTEAPKEQIEAAKREKKKKREGGEGEEEEGEMVCTVCRDYYMARLNLLAGLIVFFVGWPSANLSIGLTYTCIIFKLSTQNLGVHVEFLRPET